MGTKKQTQQTAQFDPTSMSAFKSLTPAWAGQAQNFIQSPYSNPQFQFESQLGTRQAQNLGQTNINQLLQNQLTSGFGGGVQSPFMQEMLANQARANTGLQAQLGFINPTQMANQRQQYSMGLAQGYHPLQTGQKQVESTSGLGTWLPQVAGMGLSALTGMPGLFGGGGGGGSTGAPSWFNPGQSISAQNPGFFSGAYSAPSGYGGTPGYIPGMSGSSIPGAPPPFPGY